MDEHNRITPISNNLDDNYDENFDFVDINYTQEILANMLANLMLDSEPIVPEIETTLNYTLNETNPIKYVITEEEVNKLETIKFKDILCEDEKKMCSITQEIFKDDSEIVKLPCNHYFHKDAILNWLTKEKGECPVCRYKFECMEMRVEPDKKVYSEENSSNQINIERNDFENYQDEVFILPNYLVNEPQRHYNNQAYFDFFRRESSNDDENP